MNGESLYIELCNRLVYQISSAESLTDTTDMELRLFSIIRERDDLRPALSAAEAELEKLRIKEIWLSGLSKRNMELLTKVVKQGEIITAAETENKRLREAIKKYGAHKHNCTFLHGETRCSCGIRNIIEALAEKKCPE